MSRSVVKMCLGVLFFGLLLLALPSARAQEDVEEERSCQGAFDLYFVLDK